VNHNGKEFSWRDSTAGLTVLSAPMLFLIVLPSKDKTVERYREKIVIPAVETITGQNSAGYTAPPKLAYTLQKISDYILPVRATEQQKKDLSKYGRLLPGIGQFQDALIYSILPY
jgi:hypothetical protein